MLDNNPSDLPPPPPPSALPAPIKRYAPPNQRNRSLNRRKSGDRLEKSNSLHGSETDKNVAAAFRGAGNYDSGYSNSVKEVPQRLISLAGCSNSDAAKLLQSRWDASVHSYNDPQVDLSERPTMCTTSTGPAWAGRLPHQLISGNQQMDFLAELRRQRQNHNANAKP